MLGGGIYAVSGQYRHIFMLLFNLKSQLSLFDNIDDDDDDDDEKLHILS